MMQTTHDEGLPPPKRKSPTANWAFSKNPQDSADNVDYIAGEVKKAGSKIEKLVDIYRVSLWGDYIGIILEQKP